MKTVRLSGNTVAEIIPDYALPIEKWYGAEFAKQCKVAPDGVKDGWVYDSAADTFSEPKPHAPTAQEQITEKKAALTATDYKIIKCSECSLAGVPLPYDVAALHGERQTLRDEINALETAK